jgi:hypothetical protein
MSAGTKLQRLAHQHAPTPLIKLRVALAAVWLVYDCIDLCLSKTATQFIEPSPALRLKFILLQAILIISQWCIVRGKKPQQMCAVAAAARLMEYSLFHLNDFGYDFIMLLLCCTVPTDVSTKNNAAWHRSLQPLFVLQTAYLYFATALLKLGPTWLGGGDLFVRQMYMLHVQAWPYPELYSQCVSSMACNQILALSGVTSEFLLSAALLCWALLPRTQRIAKYIAIGVCCAIHGFAAISDNVWFFGLSMVLQVACLTSYPSQRTQQPSKIMPHTPTPH